MSNILFVFEGENTEDKLVNSLTKYFFKDKIFIKCAFCAEIYQLHRAIFSDADLDTFSLLKEIPINLSSINKFK